MDLIPPKPHMSPEATAFIIIKRQETTAEEEHGSQSQKGSRGWSTVI